MEEHRIQTCRGSKLSWFAFAHNERTIEDSWQRGLTGPGRRWFIRVGPGTRAYIIKPKYFTVAQVVELRFVRSSSNREHSDLTEVYRVFFYFYYKICTWKSARAAHFSAVSPSIPGVTKHRVTQGIEKTICVWGVITESRSGSRKSDFYSQTKVFLSSVCVVIFVTRPVGDFTKSLGRWKGIFPWPRIWFIFIKTYKIATFMGYLE